MSFNRFENILNALRFGDELEQREDEWSLIRPIINGFNQTRKKVIHPGEILVVDECMSAWKGREAKYTVDGLPHKTKIQRKPEGKGAELKSMADGDSGILLGLDIVEGKVISLSKKNFTYYSHSSTVNKTHLLDCNYNNIIILNLLDGILIQ
jgi:hypothetical protein